MGGELELMARSGKPKKPDGPQPVAESKDRLMAPHELLLSSPVQGAIGIQAWGQFAGDANLVALLEGLHKKTERVLDGDMRPVEAMLYGQAVTLQTIFTSLARRATSQEYLKQFQTYLMLALKAQAQCRVTLEALAEIKNPRPVLITKQANISGGPQQVNNGAAPAGQAARAHASENATPQNGLLEAAHGIELDTGAQGATSGGDSCLEAVAARHRAAHA